MSRMLSELLGLPEMALKSGLRELEQASGHPSADIRLTAEMLRTGQSKLRELGLNPHDTTGPELYAALEERLKQDDARLAKSLQAAAHADDVMAGVASALRSANIERGCFALKLITAKRLLQRAAPKKVMKQLGYRSLESMLKHESIPALYAAAWLVESSSWRKHLTDSYRQLKPADFETRDISIINPTSQRWQELAETVVAQQRHNVLGFKELGTIVLLPLPSKEQPPAATTVTLSLALEQTNEIRAAGTFLKLCQVKSDFGDVVHAVATSEPVLHAELLDKPVAWQLIQRYYARTLAAFRSDIFEPHIQPADLSWHAIEHVLADIEPTMEFWRDTSHLGLLHERQPVSFNILDVALNRCNQLPFEQRIVHYLRHSLRHELLLRYLKHDNVEQTVLGQLQAELVAEPALL